MQRRVNQQFVTKLLEDLPVSISAAVDKNPFYGTIFCFTFGQSWWAELTLHRQIGPDYSIVKMEATYSERSLFCTSTQLHGVDPQNNSPLTFLVGCKFNCKHF
jgi:hypothetical protein